MEGMDGKNRLMIFDVSWVFSFRLEVGREVSDSEVANNSNHWSFDLLSYFLFSFFS
jgi:hypothetical protein